MKFPNRRRTTWQKAVLLALLALVVLFVVVTTGMALLDPSLAIDYEFVTVPTLTPVMPW